jgi:putative Holliday junction resolvase
MRGRRIAFDYGDARIGVAICDPDGILATPLPFIDARNPRYLRSIQDILNEYDPITIYLGRPLHLSGVMSESALKVENFKAELERLTTAPIRLIDERLSTVEAQRSLHESGKSSKESKTLIDSASAVKILEAGLASEDR